MKSHRIFLLFFLAVLLIPMEVEAQRDVYNWQITPYAGLLTINNDIAFPKNTNTYAYGLRLERRLGNDFTLGLHLSNLDLGDAVQNYISGGFISLGYFWDNGYLFSQRSFLSIYHRLEIGYADRYSTFESISGKSSDFAVGFENGLKFRLSDRISADLALELYSSKTNLTSGDIAKNIRYNVWKVGITYHFGSRKSTYVAPVFVPRSSIPTHLDKLEIKDESIWIVKDTIYNDEVKLELPVSPKIDSVMIPQLTRADSLVIFMHFDSLYQRRPGKDTLVSYTDSTTMDVDSLRLRIDSAWVDVVGVDSIRIQEYDTLKATDTIVSPIDSTQYIKPGALIISADSLKSDTIPVMERALSDSTVVVSPVVSDTVVILKTDTVFIEKPVPADFEQKADTSVQRSVIDNGPARVDTLYIVKDAAESRQKSAGDAKGKVEKSTTTEATSAQDAKISSLQSEIDRLKKENKKSNTGKVVAAGAAGAVLGAVLSHDKRPDKDTVFVVSTVDISRIDSLQNELDSLKRVYGISDVLPVAGSDSIVQPPIGMYFAGSDSASTLLPDSTYAMEADSLGSKPDSLSTMDDTLLNQVLVGTEPDSLGVSDTTAVPIAISERDTSAAVPGISAEESKDKEPEVLDKIDIPDLMGEYPVLCNFGLNKIILDNQELEKLDVVIVDLKNAENRSVLLTGYTDKSGNADYNLELSKKRANSVREYLVSKGIDAKRIEINAGGVLSSAERYSPDARRVEVRIED